MKIYPMSIMAILIVSGLLSEATHNCANGLVTTVTGGKYIAVGFSAKKYSCTGSPTGGTYTWTCSGELNITTDPNDPSIAYATASAVSSSPKDQFVKCVYTFSGKDCDDEIEITNVKYSVSYYPLYWAGYDSDGTTRLNGTGCRSMATLEVEGISSGAFEWTITEGTDKLEVAADEEGNSSFSTSVTENDDNKICVRTKARSVDKKDITISLKHDGVTVPDAKVTVRQASSLDLTGISHVGRTEYILGIPVSEGYLSTFTYRLNDQWGEAIAGYPIGEYFPSSWTAHRANNWDTDGIGITGGGHTYSDGTIPDTISVYKNHIIYRPDPVHPNTPLGPDLVEYNTQNLRAGKATSDAGDSAAGLPLRTNIIRHYLDHGSIVTDGTEYVVPFGD